MAIIAALLYVDEMRTTHDHVEGLRPRSCMEPSCRAMFAVCVSCDRGQRYCSEECRIHQRRRQVRAADKRYQESEAGKRAHCRRQQAYLERRAEAPMTHQAVATIIAPAPSHRHALTQCAICGEVNRWINPYYQLVRHRRRRRRSAEVQISPLSDDR